MRALLLVVFAWSCGPPPQMVPDAGMMTAECTPQRSPPTLTKNGGFECGDAMPAEWAVQFGQLDFVSGGHTGQRAARVTAAQGGDGQFGYATEVTTASGNTYCVVAWIKGTATDMRMEALSGGAAQSFAAPVTADWVRAPQATVQKLTPSAGQKLYLRFRIQNGVLGQTLLVDDVDLWESASGRCDEAR